MRIACVLDVDYEDSEFKEPYDAFRKAGHQVTTKAEAGIDQARPDQFDALFIPGGYSPDHLRADPKMVGFTKELFDADEAVVVDRNLVTSRQPSDIPAFIRESLKVLEKVPVGSR